MKPFIVSMRLTKRTPSRLAKLFMPSPTVSAKAGLTGLGSARKGQRWKLVILSTGEMTVRAMMHDAGKQMKAGQEVRLLNVPSARRYGAFDCLHQFRDGRSMADHLKTVCNRHYGHAGPAFVEALLKDDRDYGGELDAIIQAGQFRPEDSQSGRAAGSFALFGLAGELAAEWGILPWPEGTALTAAAECYQTWLKARGTGITGNRQILEAVSDFIAKHADSRFSQKGVFLDHGPVIHNRAGWWTETSYGERVYLFNPPGLREATTGHDFNLALAASDQAGWIIDRDKDKRTKKTCTGHSKKDSLYWIQVQGGA